jgi:hypothetical protein
MKLGALATASVVAVGMCALSTDASAARGVAHFGGHVAHFGGPRVAGNVGGWDGGYRGYGFRRYGYYAPGYSWGGAGWGYPAYAYASCYVWTPLGYVNECGYNYNYYW